jgi:hypothetical protein
MKEAKSFGQITKLGSNDGKSFLGLSIHAINFFSEYAMETHSAAFAQPDERKVNTAANLAKAQSTRLPHSLIVWTAGSYAAVANTCINLVAYNFSKSANFAMAIIELIPVPRRKLSAELISNV